MECSYKKFGFALSVNITTVNLGFWDHFYLQHIGIKLPFKLEYQDMFIYKEQ